MYTPTSYDAILERPYIHKVRVVPSTYHQSIKYPIKDGVKEIKGDQERAMNGYDVTMKNAEHVSNTN